MRRRAYRSPWLRPSWAYALVLWLAACSAPAEEQPAAVAYVGDQAIPADDFRVSYELGFAHLKQGPSPRLAYLQHMIDERLLAQEGYRLGLDERPDVRRRVESMRAELLVEQVFEREVNAHVQVTDAEIQAAMARDEVRFKLRYLPAPSYEQARALRVLAEREGFDAAVASVTPGEGQPHPAAAELESPYLAWHELDPVLLEAVRDLPPGQYSAPVPFRGSYLVLEVVDVRQSPIAPVADPDVRARYEQVLFQQKAKAAARRFIGEAMAPLGLKLKAAPVAALRRHLWAWYGDAPPESNLLTALDGAGGAYADSLRALLPAVLMTTTERDWTVRDFFEAYPLDRYPLDTTTPEAFTSDLYDAFGLTLRDRTFVARAEAEGLDEQPEVQASLRRWQDKWVYRAVLDAVADTVQVAEEDVAGYYARHANHYEAPLADVRERVRGDVRTAKVQAAVRGLLARLRAEVPVDIRQAVLDTLQVNDPDAHGGPDVVVMKGHTGRPAYPVVDPVW